MGVQVFSEKGVEFGCTRFFFGDLLGIGCFEFESFPCSVTFCL